MWILCISATFWLYRKGTDLALETVEVASGKFLASLFALDTTKVAECFAAQQNCDAYWLIESASA
jgi:hypothetical protein